MEPETAFADLFMDDDGRLCLLAVRPLGAVPGGLSAWDMLVTHGPGTIRGLGGTCVHDGALPAAEQVRRVGRAALARTGGFGLVEDDATRSALASLGWPGAAPRHAEALGRLLDVCGPATSLCATGIVAGDDLRSAEGRHGLGPVDRLARLHPSLFPLLRSLRPESGQAALGRILQALDAPDAGEQGLAEALCTIPLPRDTEGKGLDPLKVQAFLRRLGSAWIPECLPEACLRLASAVPLDWMPSAPDSLAAFSRVAILCCALHDRSHGALPLERLVSSSSGRWEDFAASLAPPVPDGLVPGARGASPGRRRDEAGRSGSRVASDVEDMILAFRRQVAVPALAWADLSRRDPAGSDAVAGAAGRLAKRLSRATGDMDPVDGRCWEIIAGGRGMVSILERSSDWHRRQGMIDRAIRTAHDPRTWDAPFPPFTAPDGALLVPLTSAADLSREGAVLRHCVGGYADRCIAGTSVIVSVRRSDAAGETVSSTAELSADHVLLQHKSARNAEPSLADASAVASLVVALGAGRHAPPTPGLDAAGLFRRLLPVRDAPDPAAQAAAAEAQAWAALDEALDRDHLGAAQDALGASCGYDWRDPLQIASAQAAWGRYLPKGPLRSDPAFLVVSLGGPFHVLDLPAVPPPGPASVAGLFAVRPARRRRLALLAAGAACLALLAGGAFLLRQPSEDAEFSGRLARLVPAAPTECPAAQVEPPQAGARCARIGSLLLTETDAGLTAYLVGDHPSVAIFRSAPGRPFGDAWPSGRQWRAWVEGQMAKAGR